MHMSDVTNDERGRRVFQLQKERAVELALEKIRRNPGSGLTSFSNDDIKTLSYILGEAWVSVGRQIWEQSSFTRLSQKDLDEMIHIGNNIKSNKVHEVEGVNQICRILRGSI